MALNGVHRHADDAHDGIAAAEVVIHYADGGVRHVPASAAPMTFGRLLDNTIVLPGPAVSRRHARLDAGPEGWTLVDLGSTHGTAVNGSRIDAHVPVALVAGDLLSIGGFEIVVWAPSDSETGDQTSRTRQTLIEVNLDRHEVRLAGTVIAPPLSRSEFRLLAALAAADGRVCHYATLGAAVWGAKYREADRYYRNSIYGLVNSVRDRLATAGGSRRWLAAVRGEGYRLEARGHD
jgi:pSer/pThr/pTyr-binding forkhead associated (FHA) protein